MIYELFGVPGCGKSTYGRQKSLEVNDAIVPLDIFMPANSGMKRNLNRISLILYFIIKNPVKSLKVGGQFGKIKCKSFRGKIRMGIYLFFSLGAIEKINVKFNNKVCYLDEGINQVIWGLYYNTNTNEHSKVDILYKSLYSYFGDEIIFLEEKKEVVYERLLARSSTGGASLRRDVVENIEALNKAYDIFYKMRDKIESIIISTGE